MGEAAAADDADESDPAASRGRRLDDTDELVDTDRYMKRGVGKGGEWGGRRRTEADN